MKAIYTLLILLIPYVGLCQQTFIADDNFEQALIEIGLDSLIDNLVLTSNIDTVEYLKLTNLNISSLEGIQDFLSLKILICDSNNIENLNLNSNIFLEELNCADNFINSLSIQSCIYLKQLRCWRNQLENLDIYNNTNLIYLGCGYNNLSFLSLDNHIFLKNLGCGSNQLDSLNLSGCPNLLTLYCASNNLTKLDVYNLNSLEYFGCWSNYIDSLDVSQNINLTELRCHNNNLQFLNIKNGNNLNISSINYSSGLNITNNPNLFCVTVDNPIYSDQNWTIFNNSINYWNNFSDNCNYEILGCTEANACNYNFDATINNFTCEYAIQYYDCNGDCINDADEDGTCDELEVLGCTEETACNFNPLATENDESCEYAIQYYDCNGDCINDADEDGICNEDEITGCTDPTACNYNDSATDEDSSCEYLNATILQFGDSLKASYDANLNVSVDWYNIQTNDSTTRYWLMLENSNIFYPSFDCSYFVIAANEFCADTSSIYYYAKEARSIGTMISSPNPTNGKTKIQFDNMKNQFVKLYLINNNGNLMNEYLTMNNFIEIDLSNYTSGVYYISFQAPRNDGCLNETFLQNITNKIILNK